MKYLFAALLLSPMLWGQALDYKKFFASGQEKYEAGQHEEALADFKEAYRLNNKAQRYRTEGAFFASYMPRYWIALCYEHIDVMQAMEWVKLSREANEQEPIKNKRKDLQAYNAGMERIEAKGKAFLAEQDRLYAVKKSNADALLAQNKFKEAKAAYNELVKMNSSKPEGLTGLQMVDLRFKTFLKDKARDVKDALRDEKFDQARLVLKQIESYDSSYADLGSLRLEIDQAEDNHKKAIALAKAEAAKPKDKPVVKAPVQSKPKPTAAQVAANKRASERRRLKKDMREELLESLKEYQKGDPSGALARLQQIEPDKGKSFQSYHWLKGLFLLSTYHCSVTPEDNLLDEARLAIKETVRLAPDFKPDQSLYPGYVVAFFDETVK